MDRIEEFQRKQIKKSTDRNRNKVRVTLENPFYFKTKSAHFRSLLPGNKITDSKNSCGDQPPFVKFV